VITVKTQSIKAACGMAATKDVRHYLVGVQILVRDNGDVHVRATDGTLAFDDLMPEKSAFAPADFIIPLEIAKQIAKSKAPTVEITIALRRQIRVRRANFQTARREVSRL